MATAKKSPLTEQEAERFWAKVAKSEEGCWRWQASTNRRRHGYGVFTVVREVDGKRVNRNLKAHRVVYELTVGPIPKGKHVLHRCDVPTCVRPDHLFVGTQKDNMRDMVSKGRQIGAIQDRERNPNTKLTWEQARQIRSELDAGVKAETLAKRFGVSRAAIYNVRVRRTWGGVTPEMFALCKRRARGES